MNTPAVAAGNWSWRAPERMLDGRAGEEARRAGGGDGSGERSNERGARDKELGENALRRGAARFAIWERRNLAPSLALLPVLSIAGIVEAAHVE